MLKTEFINIIKLSGITLDKLNMYFETKTNDNNTISCWEEDNQWYLQTIDNGSKLSVICDSEENIIKEFWDIFIKKLCNFNVEPNYCLASLDDLIILNNANYPNSNLINAWHHFSNDDLSLFFEFKRYILTGEFDLKILNLLINKCLQLIDDSDKENIELKNRYSNLSKLLNQLEIKLNENEYTEEQILEIVDMLKKEFLENEKDS